MTDSEHIEALASELNARVIFNTPRNAYTDVATRTVYTKADPGDGTVDWYWTALHELGHIADDPFNTGKLSVFDTMAVLGSPRLVAAEARAWEWALDHSQQPLTELARGEIILSLGGYISVTTGPGGAVEEADVRRVVQRIGGAPKDMEPAYAWFLNYSPNDMSENDLRMVVSEWDTAYYLATGSVIPVAAAA